jgi:hypothetical protein
VFLALVEPFVAGRRFIARELLLGVAVVPFAHPLLERAALKRVPAAQSPEGSQVGLRE